MKVKNGYSDGSGQGTITINDKSALRVHWGCSCCDYWDYDEQTDEYKLAEFIVKILKKHEKELRLFIKNKKWEGED